MSADDPTRLRLTRHHDADRERVWRAWTDDLGRWLWPERFATRVELEPRAGAPYRVWSEEVGMGVSGVVVVAEVPSRLVLTWRWDGEDDETRVTVAPDDATGGGTALALEHAGHTSAQQRADHVEGWEHCLGRLDDWLSRPPAPGSAG